MLRFARAEWRRFRFALQTLHPQTVFVLVAAVLLIVVQFTVGNRNVFYEHVAPHLPAANRGLYAWAWWFGFQGLTGFVLPVLALLLLFRRRPSEIGLGLGDWRLAGTLAGIYLPLVIVGTWVLSNDPAFRSVYPHLQEAAFSWRTFVLYESLFLFYWMGWEYLWRGFVLFGTAPTFGVYSIFVQMMPFAILHVQKPPAEAVLSIVGGVALGALVWRCRSFWIAVPIHAAQMVALDFWCTLRIRTGIEGVGLEALSRMVKAWLS